MVGEDAELAIALQYDKQADNAPRVVAKGMRLKAEKIREIARQHGVPIMRNVSLAMAIAVTLLNRVEYAVFAVVYFLTEVPLLLAFVAAARCRQGAQAQTWPS